MWVSNIQTCAAASHVGAFIFSRDFIASVLPVRTTCLYSISYSATCQTFIFISLYVVSFEPMRAIWRYIRKCNTVFYHSSTNDRQEIFHVSTLCVNYFYAFSCLFVNYISVYVGIVVHELICYPLYYVKTTAADLRLPVCFTYSKHSRTQLPVGVRSQNSFMWRGTILRYHEDGWLLGCCDV
jgi:hypothetical protein